MSDRINTLPWQPWSLNDLTEPKAVVEPLPVPVV
jgi:flagellar assembly protein FliH